MAKTALLNSADEKVLMPMGLIVAKKSF